MTARARWRGHLIESDDGATWRYADTGTPVPDHPDRPCGHCGAANTSEGHDGCLGTLPDTVNACCGHGDPADAYIMRSDGIILRGAAALELFPR